MRKHPARLSAAGISPARYDELRAIVAGLSGGKEVHSPPANAHDPFDLETLLNMPKEAT